MSDEQATRTHVGPYELLESLDKGLMGELFRARDTQSGRAALVKLVSQTVSDNPAFQRYFYEKDVQPPSLIEHPNVLQVLKIGQEGELHYVAVADVGGQRLSERLQEAPLPADEALNIVRQIAEGVRAAHRRDMVHGHLKPSDVILTADKLGRPLAKVVFLDLGVGPVDSMVSVFGEVTGAPKYMAPELIRGRSAGPESDVFSLGVIAYELFTGREPFPSDHALGYVFANCQQDCTPADQANDCVPHEVARVIGRMLAKDAAARYRSMQRVIDDLDRCAEAMRTGHVEVVPYGTDSAFARTYELPEPKVAKPRSKGPANANVLTIILAIVVLGLILERFVGRAEPERPSTQAQTGQSPEGLPEPTRALESNLGAARMQPAQEPASPQADGTAAQVAFANAVAAWERVSKTGGYELGLTEFGGVARDFPSTPYARDARDAMARIYVEWAQARTAEDDYGDAVDKYAKAIEVAPEGSEYAALAKAKLPDAMVKYAEAEGRRGHYGEAIGIYERLAEQFPGTVQAALLDTRKPGLLFSQALVAWKDDKEYDKALEIVLQILQDYPGTEAWERADEARPSLYLDAIRKKIDDGRLDEAREQLQLVTEAYPDHPAAKKAAELDAQIVFGLFQQAVADGDSAGANTHFGELFRRHPTDRCTLDAVRMRFGLAPEAGANLYTAKAAERELARARAAFEGLDYLRALGILKTTIRYVRPEYPAAAEAIAKLPAWMYAQALHEYGRGSRVECQKKLKELADLFAETPWQAKATVTLERIARPPAGMVYVPEGRFLMGSTLSDIEALIRTHGLLPPGSTQQDILLHAEVYGLLNETPQSVASTGAFYIDKTEVTNEQYQKFVDETGRDAPSHWVGGAYPDGQGGLPVANVSFADAEAYAKWAGKRLPTEAEWEKACRGVDARTFPWGGAFNERNCRHMLPAAAGPVAVGSYPTYGSPYGCLDMIGNVQEWTASWLAPYADTLMSAAPPLNSLKVVRGGAWYQQEIVPIPTRCSSRYGVDPGVADMATGFRCVQDVPLPGDTGAAP